MHSLLFLLYDLGNGMYVMLVRLASLFNPKAKDFIRGRKDIFSKIHASLDPADRKRVWFHFASLGEFEQGKPLMENIRIQYPDARIFITFFSPSGYNICKNYSQAAYIFYLPFDSRRNAERFLEIVKPDLAVFVKYEFWLHYLHEIRKRKIPALLISSVLRKDQVFFKPLIGSFYTSFLEAFSRIFLQDAASAILAKELGLTQSELAGDTRFDRVSDIAAKSAKYPEIPAFKKERKMWVLGSSWPEEEGMLEELLKRSDTSGCCFLVVPHDISEPHIRELRQKFPATLLYSEWNKTDANANVLIIDKIGMLSGLYRYADAALVGGGFGRGLHNILEAAAYGMPLIFGPHITKFWEANALVGAGGAFVVRDARELIVFFERSATDPSIYQYAAEMSRDFVRARLGATAKIMDLIKSDAWLN